VVLKVGAASTESLTNGNLGFPDNQIILFAVTVFMIDELFA
jgi:hypothetical protein